MLRKLGKDVFLYGGADFLFRFTQLLAVPVYAHILSLGDFGKWALLTVSAQLMGMVATLGVGNAVQRFYFDPETPQEERPRLISTGLFQLIASAGLVTAVALAAGFAFRDEIAASWGIEFILVVAAVAIVLPEQLAQYCLDSVRLHFAPLKFFFIALIKNLGAVLLGLVLLVQFDFGVLGLLMGVSVAAALAVPVGLLLLRRDLTLRIASDVAGKVLSYGYPFVFAAAAYWVFGSMGHWLLSAFTDIEQVGIYAIGMRFALVIGFVITAFAQAWSPFALRMYGEDPDYLANWSRVFSLWFFVLALIGLALALFAPEMMRVLTPPQYWAAAPVLAVASVAQVFYGTVQLTVLGISVAKRTILLTYAAWIAAAANVAVNLALIPLLGPVGSAIATLVAYLVLTSLFLFWSQRLHPMPLELSKLAYSLGIVVLALGAATVLNRLEVGAALFIAKCLLLLLVAGGAFAAGILDRRHFDPLLRRRAAAV
ncbi:MAG TPA: polysaccharide biosynthesis C-terminal domain-containing protein [Allosphingosinicella sp.]